MEKSMFQGLKSEESIFKGPKCGKIHVSRVENQRRRVVAPELDPRYGMLAAETLLAYSIEQEGGLPTVLLLGPRPRLPTLRLGQRPRLPTPRLGPRPRLPTRPLPRLRGEPGPRRLNPRCPVQTAR